MYVYYYYLVITFTTIILLVFFLFLMLSFPPFISLFNCIVWLFFLILSLLYFNFSSYTSSVFQWHTTNDHELSILVIQIIYFLSYYCCSSTVVNNCCSMQLYILHSNPQWSYTTSLYSWVLLLLWLTLFSHTLHLLSILYSHCISSSNLPQVFCFLDSAHNHPPL